MTTILQHPATALTQRLARSPLFPPSCAPCRAQLPATIGRRELLQFRPWASSPVAELVRNCRVQQRPVHPPKCVIRAGLLTASRAYRAADSQPSGPPGRQRPVTQAKTPLAETTKALRNQLKALTTHENIANVPNALTFSRLVAAPIVGYLVLHDQHAWALGLFAYAGVTDLVDGWIARQWKLQTVVGSVVDPMADKLLMAVTVGCLTAKGTLPAALAILIFGRDASLAIAAVYFRYASLPPPKTLGRYWDFSLPSAEVHPTAVSKFNTLVQLALVGLTLLLPVLESPSAPPSSGASHPAHTSIMTALQLIVGVTTVWSGFSYAILKDAVTILGSDEALKKRQSARGRAVIGFSFSLVCAFAVGWWVASTKKQKDDDDQSGYSHRVSH